VGIREQGYRHWRGSYTSHTFRWWTVCKQALRATLFNKFRLVGFLLFACLVWSFYFFYGIFWFFAGTSGGGELLFGVARCPDADCTLRSNLYDTVRAWEILMVPIFVGMVASPLVSNDLRSNALYIYLSKPMLRRDYILGKLAAAVLLAVPVTILPNLFVWLMAMGSRDRFTQFHDAYEILFEMVWVQLIILVVMSFAVLAASSLTKRWWVAFASVTGGYFILHLVSDLLQNTLRSPGESIAREWLLSALSTNFINFAKAVYEQPASPPPWVGSLVILLLVMGGSLGIFLWRILSLEVSE
jgi:ABC-2 type transport system permease protein